MKIAIGILKKIIFSIFEFTTICFDLCNKFIYYKIFISYFIILKCLLLEELDYKFYRLNLCQLCIILL